MRSISARAPVRSTTDFGWTLPATVLALIAAVAIGTLTATIPVFAEGLHWPLPMSDPAAQECRKKADDEISRIYFQNGLYLDQGVCQSLAGNMNLTLMNLRVYTEYVCQQEAKIAREEQAQARERELIGGSRSAVAGSYSSQKIPDSGGAGGSLVVSPQSQPPAVPDSGGAGGSEAMTFEAKPAFEWKSGPEPSAVPDSGGAGGSLVVSPQSQPSAIRDSGGAGGSKNVLPNTGATDRSRVASESATTQAPQQGFDPKTFGDAQLRLLLADPRIRARLTSLIAEELSPRKAKTEQKAKPEQQNRRGKRVRVPADDDNPVAARPKSGMSAGTAGAIDRIGIGTNTGLGDISGRGGGAIPSGATQKTTPPSGATQRTTPQPWRPELYQSR